MFSSKTIIPKFYDEFGNLYAESVVEDVYKQVYFQVTNGSTIKRTFRPYTREMCDGFIDFNNGYKGLQEVKLKKTGKPNPSPIAYNRQVAQMLKYYYNLVKWFKYSKEELPVFIANSNTYFSWFTYREIKHCIGDFFSIVDHMPIGENRPTACKLYDYEPVKQFIDTNNDCFNKHILILEDDFDFEEVFKEIFSNPI